MKLHFSKEWLKDRIENDPDLPVECGSPDFPPSPERACKERASETINGLRSLALKKHLYAGEKEMILKAIREIDNLRDSYLAACKENDHLRSKQST